MIYFLFSLIIILVAVAGLAIGLIIRGKRIEPSCEAKKKIMGDQCSSCSCK